MALTSVILLASLSSTLSFFYKKKGATEQENPTGRQFLRSQIKEQSLLTSMTFFFFFFFFVFLGPCPWHMQVPRLGVESELYLMAYTTATSTPNPSRVCDLHYGSWQCQILNPPREARDRTCIFMDTSQIRFH